MRGPHRLCLCNRQKTEPQQTQKHVDCIILHTLELSHTCLPRQTTGEVAVTNTNWCDAENDDGPRCRSFNWDGDTGTNCCRLVFAYGRYLPEKGYSG